MGSDFYPLPLFINRLFPSSSMAIEDEIIHWWKDEKGEQHRNAMRIERENAQEVNGFPRDGVIVFRIMNSASQQSIRLSPDEALRISTQLLAVAKELLNQKRKLWNEHED
ncbi:hypothetical protein COV61_01770 [Candidatus Micrarchaeota archaeon CG11_big_fil_rev_8_21_14_0_20_47_5]|nr:MAG: hypothetical protein AUJ17_02140 [Candidatus Micrarchaeota archaeon CG1_02_47_40]PIN83894.1 MAG: hypothetical protein COV61_01770 [Candidatus Micrarchaeota archaeon CG11_big_fil_rev_8_21_14_0_20_47_5]